MCIPIYVFLIHILLRTLRNIFSIKIHLQTVWQPKILKQKKEKEKLFSVFSILSVFTRKKRTNKLHIGRSQCWFNKYATTVGLLLIYDKYTQMHIIILPFGIFLRYHKAIGNIVA